MPRMTGIECLTYLKGKPDTNTIPIIIWSTSNNAKLMEQCKRLGASAYMVKQHTMQKLLEVVNTTLIQAFPS
jgi:CheY-like chemotaxis protein